MNSNISLATLALILAVSAPIAFSSGRNNKMWHVPGRVTESHDPSRCPPCAPSETTRPGPLAPLPRGTPPQVAVPSSRGQFPNGPTYPSYYQEVPPSAMSGDYSLEEDEEPMQPYPMPPPLHRDEFVPGRGELGGGRVGPQAGPPQTGLPVGPQAGPQSGPQSGPNGGYRWVPQVGQQAGLPVGPQAGRNAGSQVRPQVGQQVGPMPAGPSQANELGMMPPAQAWPPAPGRPSQGPPPTQPALPPVGPPPRFGPKGASRHQPLGPGNQPPSRIYVGHYGSGQGYIGKPAMKPAIAPDEESLEELMTVAESEEEQRPSTITRPASPSARVKPLFARPTLYKDRYIPGRGFVGDEANEESNEETKDTAKEEEEDGENKEGKQKQAKPQKPQESNEKPEEKEEDKRLVKRGRHREEEDERDDEKEENEDEDEDELDEEKDEDKKDEEKNLVEKQPNFEPMVLMVQQSQLPEPHPLEPQPPEPQRPRGRMMSAEDVTRLLGQRNCLGESTSGIYFYDGYSNCVLLLKVYLTG